MCPACTLHSSPSPARGRGGKGKAARERENSTAEEPNLPLLRPPHVLHPQDAVNVESVAGDLGVHRLDQWRVVEVDDRAVVDDLGERLVIDLVALLLIGLGLALQQQRLGGAAIAAVIGWRLAAE